MSTDTAADRDLLKALHVRVEAQEAAIRGQEATIDALRAEIALGRAQMRRAARSAAWRPVAIVLGLLILVVASLSRLPATSAQQPATGQPAGQSQPSKPSDNPLIIGRANFPSVTVGGVDATWMANPLNTQLTQRLFWSSNHTLGSPQIAEYFDTAYRVALLGTTSGVDDTPHLRIGTAGAVDTSGANSQDGFGLYGYAKGPAAYGIKGLSIDGVGAVLTGKQAPLLLTPAATAGPPTTGNHVKGELYVSSDGNLYFCTADGTPGSWTQLNTLRSYIPAIRR